MNDELTYETLKEMQELMKISTHSKYQAKHNLKFTSYEDDMINEAVEKYLRDKAQYSIDIPEYTLDDIGDIINKI